jgi:hypothetical protein
MDAHDGTIENVFELTDRRSQPRKTTSNVMKPSKRNRSQMEPEEGADDLDEFTPSPDPADATSASVHNKQVPEPSLTSAVPMNSSDPPVKKRRGESYTPDI